ncbi:hypothetical protein [Klebsiella oxytoca]|uniref:hypothetical protein n=1 Tax=Klebsiella oxytoca TaxID=571 RepID=UPI00387A3560
MNIITASKNNILTFFTIFCFVMLSILAFLKFNEEEIVLSCKFNLNTSSEIRSNSNEIVNVQVQYLFYKNKRGLRTQFGTIKAKNNLYTLHRETGFKYYRENDAYTVNFEKSIKRYMDDTPDIIINKYSGKINPVYLSFMRLKEDIYLFLDRGNPVVICTKNSLHSN